MRHQIDLLRPAAVFASVVQHGSFRAAAKTLDMSAPLVSQMITDLEARLGVQLLHRTQQKPTLTEAGEQFFETSSMLLDGFREGLGNIAPHHAHEEGILRVWVQCSLACAPLAKFMSRFQADHPDIKLELSFDDEIKPNQIDGFDLSLRLAPLDSKQKQAHLLKEVESRLIGSTSLALALRSASQLSEHDWIRQPLVSSKLLMRRRVSVQTTQIRARRHLVVNNSAMISELVEADAGFAVLPDVAIDQAVADGTLVDLMPGWIASRQGLIATISRDCGQKALARKLADALGDFLHHTERRSIVNGLDH
ncbi:DNA-binding transcriptional regulator, LysR family [Cohaesibacter sp. ES.047]|uniref:LysR family transcriptional regulator n=1 Tax=Cohaesibacter sp. ES.047 TaxID=1798205 RepID=UPI000BB77621|nr:LysR family transcriptional regulator [Cohaesibacter sp. ES.047]SNY92737.1 DNA-binding transcriptional regulator, LysR family [Cohaesibacter sp. ES.047]